MQHVTEHIDWHKKIFQVNSIFIFSFILSNCLGTRYLKEGKHLLIEQSIEGIEGFDKEEIESLYAYRPNRKILFLPWSPYTSLYELGIYSYDSSKYLTKKIQLQEKESKKAVLAGGRIKKLKHIQKKYKKKIAKQDKNIREGNFWMRLGEPLAVYDTAKERLTTQKITQYFQTKGYFNASTSYTSSSTFQLSSTTYKVNKKEVYTIDSIFYQAQDTALLHLVEQSKNSLIAEKPPYEQSLLIAERERINTLLLNNGYYSFKKTNIHFVIDSTILGNQRLVVGIILKNPKGIPQHKVYTIDSVIFTINPGLKKSDKPKSKHCFNHINYQFYQKKYSDKILDRRLFLYPHEKYSQAKTLETQKQLSNMDIYKFVNINYDTTKGNFIAHIKAIPHKKYQTSSNIGVTVSKGLPSPFVNASLKNRNTFGGLEIMELSIKAGVEGLSGVSESKNFYSSYEYGGNLSLTFAQFILPLKQKVKSKLGHLNPITRISIGLNKVDRPEYTRRTIHSSLGFNWQKDNKKQVFTLRVADINYINSTLSDAYTEILDGLKQAGNNLYASFAPSFVSSTWCSVVYNVNDYGNTHKHSSYLRYLVESGGNLLNPYLGAKFLPSNVGFFQFAKVDVDYRHATPINTGTMMVYRGHIGIAAPYSNNETLPYEKFFFIGGSNSIRAWEPRRLGPGAYLPINAQGEYNNNFEQPGEILLETSIELRHKLFGFVHGAFFIDAGNVWTIRNDPSRPGGQFKFKNFFQEIAIGAGYGLRFNFSFLLLRLDAAWKIKDPGNQTISGIPVVRDQFYFPNYKNYNRLVWNIGIGYPF